MKEVESPWTFETTIKYVTALIDKNKDIADARFLSQQEAVKAAFEAAAMATDRAHSAQTTVNAGQNEWRGQIKDQTSTFSTRVETTQLFERNAEKIEEVKKEIASLREYKSSVQNVPQNIEIARTSTDTKLEAIRLEIQSLRETRVQTQGKNDGITLSWGLLVGIVGFIALVINLLFKFK